MKLTMKLCALDELFMLQMELNIKQFILYNTYRYTGILKY